MKTKKQTIAALIIFVVILCFWLLFFRGSETFDWKTKIFDMIAPSYDTTEAYLSDPENNRNRDFIAAREALEKGDIKNAPALWEKVAQQDEWNGKIRDLYGKINSKVMLAGAYLQYGNYYHTEQDSAEKAIKILMENGGEIQGEYGIYSLGYAHEIIKRYEDALAWYEKGLARSDSNEITATFKNQIGHVYDLRWDLKKAVSYYDEAYRLDNKNYHAAGNLGRSLVRLGQIQESIQYLEYALQNPSLSARAETYYTLSSAVLEIGWLKPDIDKSISYARLATEAFPDYSMGYVALARGLYMKNDAQYNTEIENNLLKAINLNPKGYYAYEIAALHDYDTKNYERSIGMLQKAISLLADDMILMESDRSNLLWRLSAESIFLSVNSKLSEAGKIIAFIQEFQKISNGKEIVELQLKRRQSGIFKTIEKEEAFQDIINTASQ